MKLDGSSWASFLSSWLEWRTGAIRGEFSLYSSCIFSPGFWFELRRRRSRWQVAWVPLYLVLRSSVYHRHSWILTFLSELKFFGSYESLNHICSKSWSCCREPCQGFTVTGTVTFGTASGSQRRTNFYNKSFIYSVSHTRSDECLLWDVNMIDDHCRF